MSIIHIFSLYNRFVVEPKSFLNLIIRIFREAEFISQTFELRVTQFDFYKWIGSIWYTSCGSIVYTRNKHENFGI